MSELLAKLFGLNRAVALVTGAARDYAAPFDITDSAHIARAVERVEAEIGPIDILVNQRGITACL